MDFLDAVATFVRVAQSQSFSRTAQDLHVTQSRVSKQVAMLETRLGARLLDRTTRRVRLTEDGAWFMSFASHLLENVAQAEAQIGRGRDAPSGLVRVGSPSAFARRHVIHSVHRLLALYPTLRIEVIAGDLSENLVEQGIDVALRFGTVPDGTIVRWNGAVTRVAVATPSYLARAGEPVKPDDLRDHECLIFSNPNADAEWVFSSPSGQVKVGVSGRLRSNSADVVREACLDGAGIALMPEWLFRDDIALGLVRPVLPTHQTGRLFLATRHGVSSPPRYGSFLTDWRRICARCSGLRIKRSVLT